MPYNERIESLGNKVYVRRKTPYDSTGESIMKMISQGISSFIEKYPAKKQEKLKSEADKLDLYNKAIESGMSKEQAERYVQEYLSGGGKFFSKFFNQDKFTAPEGTSKYQLEQEAKQATIDLNKAKTSYYNKATPGSSNGAMTEKQKRDQRVNSQNFRIAVKTGTFEGNAIATFEDTLDVAREMGIDLQNDPESLRAIRDKFKVEFKEFFGTDKIKQGMNIDNATKLDPAISDKVQELQEQNFSNEQIAKWLEELGVDPEPYFE